MIKLIICLFIIFFELSNIFNLINNNVSKTFVILFTILTIGLNILMYIVSKLIKNKKIEMKFLIIGSFIGIIYLLGIPMMKGTDEIPHFNRIYQIYSGNIVITDKTEVKVPENVKKYSDPKGLEFYQKNVIFEKDSKKLELMNMQDAASGYSPIQYIPQVIGYTTAKIFTFGPFISFYMVRLFNLLAFLLISFYALKRLPAKKEIVSILYLAPATLSLVSTMSADAFLNANALLFIAIVFDNLYNKKMLSRKDLVILLLTGTVVATIKTVYIPILLLPLLLKDKAWKKCLIILMPIIASFVWSNLASTMASLSESHSTTQLNYIFSNPLNYLTLFFTTFTNNAYYYITNLFAGSEMIQGAANINGLLVICYLIIFVLSFFNDNREYKINNIVKYIIVFTFLLILGAIATVMYVSWTPLFDGVKGFEIIGVQSRYFIILVPILIALIPNKFKKIKYDFSNYVLLLNGLIALNALSSVLVFYFNLL